MSTIRRHWRNTTRRAFIIPQKEPGLDLRFIISVENAIERILEDPLRYRPLDEDVRRCLTRVFPYAILYTIESGFILIVAVAHLSREPGY